MATFKIRDKETGEVFTIREKEPSIETVTPKSKPTLWKRFGAEITPEMEMAYPYQSAIAKTGQEVATIPMHYFNQALLNLPRGIVSATGTQYPEAETSIGQVLSKGAGVAGAITGLPAKLLLKAPLKLAPKLAGQQLRKKIARGAIGGAVTGAVYTPTETKIPIIAPEERLMGGIAGAGLGMAGELIHGGISEGVKGIRKLRKPAKVGIKTKLGWQKKGAITTATEQQKVITQQLADTEISLKKDIDILGKNIDKAAEKGSLEFQNRLPRFFRRNSTSYGKRLDEIADNLAEQGYGLKRGQANEMLSKTLQEADEALLQDESTYQAIVKLKEKYKISPDEQLFADNPIDFKEFVNDIRKISDMFSSSIKGGIRFTRSDIAISILKKNMGEIFSNTIPEFQALQKAYRPVIQAMKLSGKIFKPYAGEMQTKGGTQFLKKVAYGKLEAGEKKLLEAIEKGTEFGEGIGNLSKGIQQLGQEITTAKANLKNLPILKRKALERVITNKTNRLQMLEQRGQRIEQLLANKRRAIAIKKVLIGTPLGILGSHLLWRAARTIGSGGRTQY